MRCHFTINLEKVQRGFHFEKDPSKGTNVLLETSTSRERPKSVLYCAALKSLLFLVVVVFL